MSVSIVSQSPQWLLNELTHKVSMRTEIRVSIAWNTWTSPHQGCFGYSLCLVPKLPIAEANAKPPISPHFPERHGSMLISMDALHCRGGSHLSSLKMILWYGFAFLICNASASTTTHWHNECPSHYPCIPHKKLILQKKKESDGLILTEFTNIINPGQSSGRAVQWSIKNSTTESPGVHIWKLEVPAYRMWYMLWTTSQQTMLFLL